MKNKYKKIFSKRFKTITIDNGLEFINAKGRDVGKVSSQTVKKIEDYMNNYPSTIF